MCIRDRLNATRSGSCVNADEAAVVAGAVDGEELGRSRDESGDDVGVDNQGEGGVQDAHGLAEGDSSGGVDGSRFKGVSSADLAEAMRAVGSKVQRQADGGYLLEEERKFLDDGVEDGDPYLDGVETERSGVMDAPRARVRFAVSYTHLTLPTKA